MSCHFPSSGFPHNILSSHVLWIIPLVNWAQLSQLCPSQLLVHPQPPHWWGGVRDRRGLYTAQTLDGSNENISVLLTAEICCRALGTLFNVLWFLC
uniref:Uncharacterized protein n=1 Tax=Geospiza parvula TaxID=87175 RepID=A0A8U8BEB2_GEOPR